MMTLTTKRLDLTTLILALCVLAASWPANPVQAQTKKNSAYYPVAGDNWQRRSPEETGMDRALLDAAVAYAKTKPGRCRRISPRRSKRSGACLGLCQRRMAIR